MQPGDWVGLPSKFKRVIHFAEITGPYEFDGKREPRIRHFRAVKWFALDVPRSNFAQDILYAFGAAGTICGIDFEDRIRAMAANGWKAEKNLPLAYTQSAVDEDDANGITQLPIDLEESARDQIAKLITRKFKDLSQNT
jgi:restriction system protein